MADQISKTKSKAQVLKMKCPRICLKTLMVGLCVLVANICSVLTATCPPSVPFSATKISEQCSFSGFNSVETYGVAGGPVSSSLYYLYRIFNPTFNASVRKVDASGSQTWVASFASYLIVKSLSVDAAEQSVYLASFTNPIMVIRLAASDGSVVSQHLL